MIRKKIKAVMHNTPDAMRSVRKYLNIFLEDDFDVFDVFRVLGGSFLKILLNLF